MPRTNRSQVASKRSKRWQPLQARDDHEHLATLVPAKARTESRHFSPAMSKPGATVAAPNLVNEPQKLGRHGAAKTKRTRAGQSGSMECAPRRPAQTRPSPWGARIEKPNEPEPGVPLQPWSRVQEPRSVTPLHWPSRKSFPRKTKRTRHGAAFPAGHPPGRENKTNPEPHPRPVHDRRPDSQFRTHHCHAATRYHPPNRLVLSSLSKTNAKLATRLPI